MRGTFWGTDRESGKRTEVNSALFTTVQLRKGSDQENSWKLWIKLMEIATCLLHPKNESACCKLKVIIIIKFLPRVPCFFSLIRRRIS